METIIAGVYENGQIFLDKQPDFRSKTRVKVIFEEEVSSEPKKRQFGIGRGSIEMSDDFDAPLDDLKDYM